jgi:N-formylglutamate deformylase
MTDWLTVARGDAPVIVSIPHAGTEIPADITGLRSMADALHDADYFIDRLYGFAADLGVTIVRTTISRTVIDVNRDPSGASLYPGQATTGLCPETTFSGVPLYVPGAGPSALEIDRRRTAYFDPYHAAIRAEISRLRSRHATIVVYDAHSIVSRVPRLFDGELPQFNMGTFDGASCDVALTTAVAAACAGDSQVINGRFKGGWITRHHGDPAHGVHAIQMELAMRGYLDETAGWPPIWDAQRAMPMQIALRRVLAAALTFAAALNDTGTTPR